MEYTYNFYLDTMLFPVTPSKVTTKIKNQNKTITLINEGEVNLIKSPGLTEISFDALLPMHYYPFAKYIKDKKRKGIFEDLKYYNNDQYFSSVISNQEYTGFLYPNYYLDKLEEMKLDNKPVSFKVIRDNKKKIFSTNILVTIEDYSVVEDAEEGHDLTVSIKLKQYIEYGTKEINIFVGYDGNINSNNVKKRKSTKKLNGVQYYIVNQGDTLWGIAKKFLGDGSKCWNLAKINGINNPNLIYPGQKLIIKEVKSSTAKEAGYSISKKPRRQVSKHTRTTVNTNKPKGVTKKNSIVTEAVIVDPLNYDTSKIKKSKNNNNITGTKGNNYTSDTDIAGINKIIGKKNKSSNPFSIQNQKPKSKYVDPFAHLR